MKYVDLHVHSTASDGTLTPSEVVDHAVEVGLSAFALTDHDTISGIAEARQRAAWHRAHGHAIEVYSGVEISAAWQTKEIHILGLCLDETNELLQQTLAAAKESRERRNEKIIEKFQAVGIALTMDELRAEAPNSVITRGHFARALLKRGITASIQEAFEKYIGDTGPCYVPREYMAPERAIHLIKKAGGVPVLAHPLRYHLSHDELFAMIEQLTAFGIKGIEVYYSSNSGSDEADVKALANHFGLISTGGSDFHGSIKPTIALGSGKGNLKIPYSVLENVLAAR